MFPNFCILLKFIRPIISVLTIFTDHLQHHTHTTTTTNDNVYSGNFLSEWSRQLISQLPVRWCTARHAHTRWYRPNVPYPIHMLKPNAQCEPCVRRQGLKRWLHLERGVLVNGILVPLGKRHVKTQKTAVCESGSTPATDRICQHLITGPPSPQNNEK